MATRAARGEGSAPASQLAAIAMLREFVWMARRRRFRVLTACCHRRCSVWVWEQRAPQVLAGAVHVHTLLRSYIVAAGNSLSNVRAWTPLSTLCACRSVSHDPHPVVFVRSSIPARQSRQSLHIYRVAMQQVGATGATAFCQAQRSLIVHLSRAPSSLAVASSASGCAPRQW